MKRINRREFIRESTALGAAAAAMGGGLMFSDTATGDITPRTMPRIALGKVKVSRFILGSNPFFGYAHRGGGVGDEMRKFYTDERIVEVMDEAASLGVTAVAAPPSERWNKLWKRYKADGGKLAHWIAQPDRDPKTMQRQISASVDAGATLVLVQGERADETFKAGDFDAIRGWVEHGRELDVPIGLASHRPEAHLEYERRGFPTDFYFQCVYQPEDYAPELRKKAFAAIAKIDKPVIAYKILAAGRNDPAPAFAYAMGRLRAKDGVCVGVFPKGDPGQVREDVRLTLKAGD